MGAGKRNSTLAGCVLLVACSGNPYSYWDLQDVEDPSRLTVSFDPGEPAFERSSAQRSDHVDGWVESGVWRADEESGKSTVWIYLATLYDKAFQKKHIRPLPEVINSVSGDSFLEFAQRGSLNSDSGAIEYQFYRASGLPCVFIRKYWNDAEISGDASRAIALQWVAGTNLIYAYYCRASGPDLQGKDLRVLFDGIGARNLYWPGNMFTVVAETAS